MTTKQLEMVQDLSRTLNFRQTAENLFISQPALTHQIKNLEEELGFQIFARNTQGVSLTPAGKIFCQNTGTVLSNIRNIIAAGRNCSREYSDSVTFCINPQRHVRQISSILRQFHDKTPDVMVQIRKLIGKQKNDAFLRGEVDLTVFVSESIPAFLNVNSIKLYESRLYTVVRREHPLAQKDLITAYDLEGQTLLASEGPRFLANAQNDLKRKVEVREQLSQSLEEALLWVQALDAAALIPGYCYFSDPDYAWIPYDWPETSSFHVAWHKDDHRKCIQDMVEISKNVFEQDRRNGFVL